MGFLDSAGTDWPLFLVEQSVVKAAWLPRMWSYATAWNPRTPQPVLVKDGFCLLLIFLVSCQQTKAVFVSSLKTCGSETSEGI